MRIQKSHIQNFISPKSQLAFGVSYVGFVYLMMHSAVKPGSHLDAFADTEKCRPVTWFHQIRLLHVATVRTVRVPTEMSARAPRDVSILRVEIRRISRNLKLL
jgi:hypothetical protein